MPPPFNADDSSPVCGEQAEDVEAPSPVAKLMSSKDKHGQNGRNEHEYNADLLHVENQLAQVQKRLAQATAGVSAQDEDNAQDLDLLLETRGLIRYASFRLRRSRRLRDQSANEKANAPPAMNASRKLKRGSTPNGASTNGRSSKPRPVLDLQSSIASVDAYDDDDASSSRVTSASEVFTQHSIAESISTADTNNTEYADDDEEDKLDDTMAETPRKNRNAPNDLATMLRDTPMEDMDFGLVIARMSDELEKRKAAEKPNDTSKPAPDIDRTADTLLPPEEAKKAVAFNAQEPDSDFDPDASTIETMIEEVEENMDTTVDQVSDSLLDRTTAGATALLDGARSVQRGTVKVVSSHRLQGMVLGLLWYRLFLALAIYTRLSHPGLLAAAEPPVFMLEALMGK